MSNYYNRQWRLPNNENKDKQSNYSMDFDGTNYIDLGDSVPPFNQTTSKFSISFWLNRSAGSNKCVFENRGSSYNSGVTLDIGISTFLFYIYPSTGGYFVTQFPISSVPINQWKHIAIVFDGTQTGNTNRLKIYVDNSSLTLTYTNNVPSNVGGSGTGDNFRLAEGYQANFQGKIDGFSMFNYPLSSSQVTTLYGSSSTGIGNPMSLSPKPVAYYPLGDQDSFNGSNYLVPNSSLKDYVFSFGGSQDIDTNFTLPASYTSFSYSFWFRWTSSSNPTGNEYLIGNGVSPGNNNQFRGGVKFRSYGGVMNLSIFGGDDTNTDYNVFPFVDATSILDQQWHHISITFVSGEIKTFFDGSLVNTYTNSLVVTGYAANRSYVLGQNGLGSGYLNNAELSNFQIFNTALPETGSNSVETLYNNGSPLTSMSGFTSLQGWWKLDASAAYDSSTTTWTILDDSTNSNDGTSSGMTQANLVQSDLSFTSGYSPYALDFDGATYQRVEIPNYQNNFPSNQIFTISTWVRINSADNYCFWGIKGTGDNALYTYVTNGTGLQIRKGNTTSSNIPNVLTIGEWANVVAVFDSTTNCKLYINNVFIQNITTASLNTTNTNDFFIGAGINKYYVLDHSQSNLSIWNAALTSSQVSEIYNEGVPSNLNNHSAYSNLTNWWQLGSNSSFNTNWTVLDEKGSNDGTSVNMTEDDIVDGVGSYANGLSSGMGGDEVIGDAPYSSSNSLSVNMDVEDRTTDTPS